jgi:hypothetical protein
MFRESSQTTTARSGSIADGNGAVNEQGLLSGGYGFAAFAESAGPARGGRLIARFTLLIGVYGWQCYTLDVCVPNSVILSA